nr:MAG TPA: hypothetical protein [Bacteriophage sp.]
MTFEMKYLTCPYANYLICPYHQIMPFFILNI